MRARLTGGTGLSGALIITRGRSEIAREVFCCPLFYIMIIILICHFFPDYSHGPKGHNA
jgi:hypothetical protein